MTAIYPHSRANTVDFVGPRCAPNSHDEGRRLPNRPARMLFLRSYRTFAGGHLKYLHYLQSTLTVESIRPELFLTPDSVMDAGNIFLTSGAVIVPQLQSADCYFIAGGDWGLLDAANIDTRDSPVVNLIQGMGHANSLDPRFAYLSRRALRICVSPEIESALLATGRVNGPVVTIPMGIDLNELEGSAPVPKKPRRVFIGAAKAPALGVEVAAALAGMTSLDVDLSATMIDRHAFLTRMAEAEICIVLPLPQEGFFLPALEAMALEAAVVVPDCIGNRTFCRHQETCIVPEATGSAIAAAACTLAVNATLRARLARAGRAMASRYSMIQERKAYIAHLLAHLADWRRR
jgi:hypothetical protein